MKILTLPCARCGGIAADGSLCDECAVEYEGLLSALSVTDPRVKYLVNTLGFTNLCSVIGRDKAYCEYLLLKQDWSAYEYVIHKAYMALRYEEIRRADAGVP